LQKKNSLPFDAASTHAEENPEREREREMALRKKLGWSEGELMRAEAKP
jgi:hypothetical protein